MFFDSTFNEKFYLNLETIADIYPVYNGDRYSIVVEGLNGISRTVVYYDNPEKILEISAQILEELVNCERDDLRFTNSLGGLTNLEAITSLFIRKNGTFHQLVMEKTNGKIRIVSEANNEAPILAQFNSFYEEIKCDDDEYEEDKEDE